MDLFYRKNLTAIRNHQTAVWTFTDEGQKESVAEIFIRAPGGVYYHCERYTGELPPLATLYYATYQRGVFSARPYHLQSARDASTFYCVMALCVSCCRAWNLDAIDLLERVDPSGCISDYNLIEIKEHARWERAVFPGTWDTIRVDSLAGALGDVECTALAQLVRERTVIARGY